MTNNNVKKVDLGNVKGEKGVTGEKGVGILEINPTPIQSTSTSDTFEITYTDGSKGRITFPRKIFETTNNIDNINNTDSYNIIPTVKAIKNLKTSLEDKIYNIKVIEIVTVLPSENIKDNRVYLLYKGVDSDDNLNATFDIYINKTKNSDGWEKLDNLTFKISDYYTKSEADIRFAPIGHEHLTSKIKNSQKLDNIGTVANATQFQINKEIDSVVGRLNSHTHGNLTNEGKVGTSNNSNKNVVTDASGKITTEDKPTIPTKLSELENDISLLTNVSDNDVALSRNATLTGNLNNTQYDFNLDIMGYTQTKRHSFYKYSATISGLGDANDINMGSLGVVRNTNDTTSDGIYVIKRVGGLNNNYSYSWERIGYTTTNTYTKSEIDALIGNIEEDMLL